jgi:hypothetical protein
MKRAESVGESRMKHGKPVSKKVEAYLARNLFTEAEAQAKLEKREFGAKERQQLAGTGAAEPDGSFPIKSEQDLKNAIRAVGRSKNPAKTRAHIMSRARSLGLTSLIPSKWKSGAKKRLQKTLQRFTEALQLDKALDFNTAQAAYEAREYADGMICEVREAVCSLQQAVCSIMGDDAIADKQKALEATFSQFHDHLGGIVPEGVEQALQAAQLVAEGAKVNAQGAVIDKLKGSKMAMDPKEQERMTDLEKKVAAQKSRRKEADARAETAEKNLAKAETALASTNTRLLTVMKMEPAHRDWLNHPDNDLTDTARLSFIDASVEKRAEIVAASPPEAMLSKRMAGVPEPLRKELEEGRAWRVEQAKRDDAAQQTAMNKRATDLGLPEAVGKAFLALSKVDGGADAVTELERVGKAFSAQERTALIYKEFGSNGQGGDGDGTATAMINKRADEMMKADPTIKSVASAIAKISGSGIPSDREMWLAYKAETTQAASA